jgi:hypothetical protein
VARSAIRGTLAVVALQETKGGSMTTGDHYHNRPMVNWCEFWQMMAAKPTESRPWWAVMAARIRQWLTRA